MYSYKESYKVPGIKADIHAKTGSLCLSKSVRGMNYECVIILLDTIEMNKKYTYN